MGRRRNLTIDSLERRDLLSLTPFINGPGWAHAAASGTGAGGGGGAGSGGQGQNGSGSGTPNTINPDPATGIYADNSLGGSGITTDITPPRGNETARRTFTATFSGKVQELPPRLLNQARQFYFLGQGHSTAFLHGTAQVRYYTPNPDPILIPNPQASDGSRMSLEKVYANTGTLSMSDRSTQSGTVILANLVGSLVDVDKLGRPTHFGLTLNGGGGSGGVYASSTGSGTVDIAYRGNRATLTVHASIFTSGVGNPYDIFQGVTL